MPIPFVFGRERGRFFFTLAPSEWRIHEIEGPNNHVFTVLPALTEFGAAWAVGKTPVTNDQYREFVQATRWREPLGEHLQGHGEAARWLGPFRPWEEKEFSSLDLPVVCVDLRDAVAYSEWLSRKGLSLWSLKIAVTPTEVWDFAAFGSPYPSFDRRTWLTGLIHDNSKAPAIVSMAPERSNRFGVIDLFGNVWEWTFGEYSTPVVATEEQYRSTMRNLQLRGGSFLDNLAKINPVLTAGAMRDGIETKHSDLGFRLAAEIPISDLPEDVVEKLRSTPLIQKRDRGVQVGRSVA